MHDRSRFPKGQKKVRHLLRIVSLSNEFDDLACEFQPQSGCALDLPYYQEGVPGRYAPLKIATSSWVRGHVTGSSCEKKGRERKNWYASSPVYAAGTHATDPARCRVRRICDVVVSTVLEHVIACQWT
jgi:hypothetical protein